MAKYTEDDMEKMHPLSRKLIWLGDPKVKRNFMYLPIIGMIIMIGLGIVFPMDDKHKAPWDFFGSWALIGFFAYSFVVFSAAPLFKLLSRGEDYYGEGSLPDPFEPAPNAHHGDDHD